MKQRNDVLTVGAGKLLEGLEHHAEEGAVERPVRRREALAPPGLEALLGLDLLVHLLDLVVHDRVLRRDAVHARQRRARLLQTALLRQPARGLGLPCLSVSENEAAERARVRTMKTMPKERMSGHRKAMPTTVRQLPDAPISRVPMLTQYAMRIPSVINSW
jgi:hypothetical protein